MKYHYYSVQVVFTPEEEEENKVLLGKRWIEGNPLNECQA